MTKRVVVLGGGIAGLAAAHRLHTLRPDLEVVLLDQRARLGGKLSTGVLAGQPVERGAESFLVGGPSAALELAREVGLGERVVHPTGARAAVAIGGVLQALPAGTLMGIPLRETRPQAAAKGIPLRETRPQGAAKGIPLRETGPLLAPGADTTVGALVRPWRGDEVVDHYVDPLLGGVYAGRADRLSVRMALPALADAAERHDTLTGALEETLRKSRREPGAPVFGAIEGGM